MSEDRRITFLEEKIAWLEDQLQSQAEILDRVLENQEKLKSQLKMIYAKTLDPYAVRSQKDEVPPPHY